jgi:methionyl-tRNA formyltransferase
MRIQILCDNINSWIIPYAKELLNNIISLGHDAELLNDPEKVTQGDILIMLSCEKIFKKLHLNKNNLVVHESALPKGKGWSPLTWQIIEGKNEIPITLFEATSKVDAGNIYGQEIIKLNGSELIDELREKQGLMTQKLILNFINSYPNIIGIAQKGEESFYPRRKPEDSKLDLQKTLSEQFNLLRVCDNERYPAWFEENGVKFIIKIYKV